MDGMEIGLGAILLALIIAFIAAMVGSNHGPSKWEILLQKCEEQNQLTKDYKVCEKKVLDAKKKEEDDDAETAVIVNSAITMATVATMQ